MPFVPVTVQVDGQADLLLEAGHQVGPAGPGMMSPAMSLMQMESHSSAASSFAISTNLSFEWTGLRV